MDYLENLMPGKRENAFYVKSDIVDGDRIGVQSPGNQAFYVHVWDPEQGKHVGMIVDRNEFDTLG